MLIILAQQGGAIAYVPLGKMLSDRQLSRTFLVYTEVVKLECCSAWVVAGKTTGSIRGEGEVRREQRGWLSLFPKLLKRILLFTLGQGVYLRSESISSWVR
ncbi:MAG: hypothetical protein HC925_04540 [Coleofasciculaceae cyanobacterium SM2_3_26]|nr:hypothetical protein [Coleofasciculaceae cyanobacterium SM2_3_26]